MKCRLCGGTSGIELLCDVCAEQYFVHDCVSCEATWIHLRGPISGRCISCSDPATVGRLPDEILLRVDGLIAGGSRLAACRLIMDSSPCSLMHAVSFIEERRRKLSGSE